MLLISLLIFANTFLSCFSRTHTECYKVFISQSLSRNLEMTMDWDVDIPTYLDLKVEQIVSYTDRTDINRTIKTYKARHVPQRQSEHCSRDLMSFGYRRTNQSFVSTYNFELIHNHTAAVVDSFSVAVVPGHALGEVSLPGIKRRITLKILISDQQSELITPTDLTDYSDLERLDPMVVSDADGKRYCVNFKFGDDSYSIRIKHFELINSDFPKWINLDMSFAILSPEKPGDDFSYKFFAQVRQCREGSQKLLVYIPDISTSNKVIIRLLESEKEIFLQNEFLRDHSYDLTAILGKRNVLDVEVATVNSQPSSTEKNFMFLPLNVDSKTCFRNGMSSRVETFIQGGKTVLTFAQNYEADGSLEGVYVATNNKIKLSECSRIENQNLENVRLKF